MTISVESPSGKDVTQFTTVGALGWDYPSSISVLLRTLPGHPEGPYLYCEGDPNPGVFGGVSPNQGSCINALYGLRRGSLPPGILTCYWEIQWTKLIDPGLLGGIGIVDVTGGKHASYSQLAADGTGGVIVRPNGEVWAGGEMIGSGPELVSAASDLVGIFYGPGGPDTDPEIPPGITCVFMNGKGPPSIFGGMDGILGGTYVPVVVFGQSFSLGNQVLANFGLNGADSFLGPTLFPDEFAARAGSVVMGWPNVL